MNKVAIVTGASRGIGAATAKLLAAQGYKVCVNYLKNQAAADAVVEAIHAQGGEAICCQADVAEASEVKRLFDQTEAKLGAVTHLVNNVGVLFEQAAFKDISLARFERVLKSNLVSCFLCCQEAIKRMQTGAIVNVSSLAARSGSPFEYVDYAASKGAMDTLTRGLALELAGSGIRVNGVRPGSIDTDIHSDGGEPGRVARLAPQIPLQRGGTAEEVAEAIAWLLGEQSRYITGTFIDVAGGR
ncbi:MAG: SDR family oxidoreductase [Pseudomonadota bacterium]|uniref:SDR family oxidoreductase n=1 Tax=Gallaecimonas pentaromativorans TaxID=584787 RepID=UPI00067EF87E|nr:SDR family oxidoreductase [Gallaecimonas pentaromativorans]MED5525937.1 SDR family oxidoreductase [Pseudomonadota bacterium]